MAKKVVFQGRQEIVVNMRGFADRIRQEILVLLNAEAPEYEREAKEAVHARTRWTDITANARNTLHATVGHGDDIMLSYLDPLGGMTTSQLGDSHDDLDLVLAHGVYYGVFLELANNQEYATIIPTMMMRAPKTMVRIKALLA